MAEPLCTDAQFIAAWKETGSATAIKERFGFSSTESVANRRRSIERRMGITLASSSLRSVRNAPLKAKNSRRIELKLDEGSILIGSDAHVWPGDLTTAQRGFIEIAKRVKPDAIVMNGDVFDGARISRHPPSIWSMEHRPNVKQELDACDGFLGAVEKACPAKRFWLLGNHDMRLEARLAAMVPEYEGVPGFSLKDHFPAWMFGMAMFVNDNLVIKHRYANGLHAAHNNAVKSGRSIVTGHLHSLKVTPWTDYNGTRYGTDCGTLADPDGPQFDYSEENPANHRAGFVLLTIRSGRLLMPELVQVWDDNHIEFRGELIEV